MELRPVPGFRRGATYYTRGDGYYFTLQQKKDQKYHYRCWVPNCKVRIYECKDKNVYNDNLHHTDHNHLPEPLLEDIITLRHNIIKRVQIDTLPLKTIFEEECNKVPKEVSKNLNYLKMGSTLQKCRRKGLQTADEYGSLCSHEENSEKNVSKSDNSRYSSLKAKRNKPRIVNGKRKSERKNSVGMPEKLPTGVSDDINEISCMQLFETSVINSTLKENGISLKIKEEVVAPHFETVYCADDSLIFKNEPIDIHFNEAEYNPVQEPASLEKSDEMNHNLPLSSPTTSNITEDKVTKIPTSNDVKNTVSLPEPATALPMEQNRDFTIPTSMGVSLGPTVLVALAPPILPVYQQIVTPSDNSTTIENMTVSLQNIPASRREAAKRKILDLVDLISTRNVDPSLYKILLVPNNTLSS